MKSQQRTHILRSAGLVGLMTLLSRILGMVRDIATASLFGTSMAMSAFVVAFTLPNLFRRLFGEGALASAFVPIFIETREQEGEPRAWQLADRVITMTAALLAGLVVLGWAVMYALDGLPGLSAKAALTLSLGRVMLPYMLFICLCGLAQAILNSYRCYGVPAATPALLNIVWFVAVVGICPRLGTAPAEQIRGLAWAILVAGVLQLGVQVPKLVGYGYRPRFSFHLRDAKVWRIVALMGPAAVGLAVTQVNTMVDRLLAAWIGDWAPAAMFFSERLLYVPQGLLATAMSSVLLPTLSVHAAQGDYGEIRATVQYAVRMLLFIMAPAALGLLSLSGPLVRAIYEWQLFDATSSLLTARALAFYSLGLLFFCLPKVFVPAFYALQDTRTPVRIGLWSVALNFVLNIVFILTWPRYFKHAGLACATVMAEAFNGLWLGLELHRRIGLAGWRQLVAHVLRNILAAAIMAVAIAALYGALVARAETIMAAKAARIFAVGISVPAGVLFYTALSVLFRSPELREAWSAFVVRRRNR